MPRQNRVDPFGDLIETSARGTLMGNRGCLHDDQGRLVKRWARKPWVTCLLAFRGRHRQIMAPGQYTELFFLDEVTALAAGHRPCGTCQKSRYDQFKWLWLDRNRAELAGGGSTIAEIDAYMHDERIASAGMGTLWRVRTGELPNGSMFTLEADDRQPWVKWDGRMHRWTASGYDRYLPVTEADPVFVITPKSIVRLLSAGFVPTIHGTAQDEAALSVVADEFPSGQAGGGRSTGEAVAAPPKHMKGEEMAVTDQQLHRLEKTPSGKTLYAYFAAILRVTGMDRGAVYPLKKFLGNFSTHEQAGRIEKADGGYRLTRAGNDYFADRFRKGNPQHISELEVKAMVKGILSGGSGWEPVR